MRGHDPRAENLNDDWIAKTQLLVPTSSRQVGKQGKSATKTVTKAENRSKPFPQT